MSDMMASEAFKDIIRIVGRGRKLQRDMTREEAEMAMRLLLSGEVSDAQAGAFLITMRVKEETVEEIIGFVQGARSVMPTMPRPQVQHLLDLALPYDGKASKLQTGVAAALVLAAAGVPVIMHGADNIPAKTGVGPLNLMRALGYPVDVPAETVVASIEATNLGVLNMGLLFPQWTALTPIRHHFGLRTLMNTVEKLFNPAQAAQHISGFYHGSYLNRMAAALPAAEGNWIVQGEEGSVDIRPGKKTRVYQAVGADMVETMIDARDYGFEIENPLETVKDPDTHAEIIRDVLAGSPGPATNQVILTAGTLLWMVGQAQDVQEGIELAREILATGQALALLESTIQVT